MQINKDTKPIHGHNLQNFKTTLDLKSLARKLHSGTTISLSFTSSDSMGRRPRLATKVAVTRRLTRQSRTWALRLSLADVGIVTALRGCTGRARQYEVARERSDTRGKGARAARNGGVPIKINDGKSKCPWARQSSDEIDEVGRRRGLTRAVWVCEV